MAAFVVRASASLRVAEILSEAGKGIKGKDWFAQVMDRLPDKIASGLKAHSQYLCDLKDEGKLLFAYAPEDLTEGVIVFAAENLEEAKSLAEGDPFMKSGMFTGYQIERLHHWI